MSKRPSDRYGTFFKHKPRRNEPTRLILQQRINLVTFMSRDICFNGEAVAQATVKCNRYVTAAAQASVRSAAAQQYRRMPYYHEAREARSLFFLVFQGEKKAPHNRSCDACRVPLLFSLYVCMYYISGMMEQIVAE